jgi:NAD(P)-dependent dehydrogenase (short-subunit alcohol dehydrogenase family)
MAGTVVIYGGSGGIGAATAQRLKQRGYALHLVGRDAARLEAAAAQVGATFTAGDVQDPALFAQVTQDAGPTLAGLVYAVGTINLKSFPRLSAADFQTDFAVNAAGAALAIQAALSALKKHDGTASVVLFSSIAATQGFGFHASIGMAKAALNGLTLSLASELAPWVRVNAIAPSLTRTQLAAGLLANEQTAANIAALHPLPRLGTPDDIAGLAAFLISPDADWITGQVIGVDGGRSTLRPKG